MEKYDLVTVYEDPITCKKIEGTVILLTKHDHHLEGCERWVVRFKGELHTYVREINIENH